MASSPLTPHSSPVRPESRIYVAGHRGLAGSALVRRLEGRGYRNLVLRTHAELELADRAAVRALFEKEHPEHVYLAAAKVGGIMANFELPADFVYLNLTIQNNVIEEARRAGVKRLLFLGSVCIYPRDCPQPIREEHLLTGPLEFTNRPYAIAKIAGIEMCWAYNRQYGTRYLAAMPNNLYGPGDNYDLRHSHVLPAFIRKFHEAKAGGAKSVTLWGTGTPRREMLHSDDMAEACVRLMELPDDDFARIVGTDPAAPQPPLINIGWGEDYTIRELAQRVRETVGFQGAIEWDAAKPDGTPRKLLDVSRMKALGWSPRVTLDAGLRQAYADFLSRFG
ncbi:MAG TPA: GDP-L-fucose synthase [Burkholderiales bacterium]|nr:GDP-L-fucose synthase [Burkholderiales bacterium]